jgi:hypothetical protein
MNWTIILLGGISAILLVDILLKRESNRSKITTLTKELKASADQLEEALKADKENFNTQKEK